MHESTCLGPSPSHGSSTLLLDEADLLSQRWCLNIDALSGCFGPGSYNRGPIQYEPCSRPQTILDLRRDKASSPFSLSPSSVQALRRRFWVSQHGHGQPAWSSLFRPGGWVVTVTQDVPTLDFAGHKSNFTCSTYLSITASLQESAEKNVVWGWRCVLTLSTLLE